MCVTRHTPSELQPILTLSEGSCMWNDYQKCMMSTRLSVDWLLNQRHKAGQGGLLCLPIILPPLQSPHRSTNDLGIWLQTFQLCMLPFCCSLRLQPYATLIGDLVHRLADPTSAPPSKTGIECNPYVIMLSAITFVFHDAPFSVAALETGCMLSRMLQSIQEIQVAQHDQVNLYNVPSETMRFTAYYNI